MTDAGAAWSFIIITLFFWVVWAFIFHRFAKSDDPDTLLKRVTRWLLREAFLNWSRPCRAMSLPAAATIVAHPSARFGASPRNSAMLLCFGPGSIFSFVERFQKLKPKPADANKNV